jgi:hypothetical protein
MRCATLLRVLCLLIPSEVLAKDLTITFYSDPPGATVYANESKQVMGYAPVVLKYKVTKAFAKGGCDTLTPIMVRWVSGAEASVSALKACGDKGFRQQFNFVRPDGVPGRDLDVQFAIALQQGAAQRAPAAVDPLPLRHCWSQIIGSQIFTWCNP